MDKDTITNIISDLLEGTDLNLYWGKPELTFYGKGIGSPLFRQVVEENTWEHYELDEDTTPLATFEEEFGNIWDQIDLQCLVGEEINHRLNNGEIQ